MIPFNRPSFAGNERMYMTQAIENKVISGDGPFTRRAQDLLKAHLGCHAALLTTNCTHALEMSALLLDLEPGDEVIVPAFTFVSTVNAFALRRAVPVFVDIRPDTLNLDEAKLESAITGKTKAIVVVHYAGVACEMDAIMAIAERHKIIVIEDNAHGLFATYHGRLLGTIGTLATQSFHETKNFTCGEGGALIVNDPSYIERAEIVREKGTNRSRFFRGQVDKYTWVDLGSSYVLSDLLAAFLLAQLEERDAIQRRRRDIWTRYNVELRSWALTNGATMPTVLPDREQSYHLFYLLMPSLADRTRFIADLRAREISAVFHYTPLHKAPEAVRARARGDCPITESVSDRLVRLPFFNSMTDQEQSQIIDAVSAFRTSIPA